MAGNPKYNGKWNQKFITEKHKTQEIKKKKRNKAGTKYNLFL